VALCQQILAASPDHGDGAPLFSIDYPLSNPAEAERDQRLVSFHLLGDADAFFVITDQYRIGVRRSRPDRVSDELSDISRLRFRL
jgi:hypothetical protein